jgi:hypothetical protein
MTADLTRTVFVHAAFGAETAANPYQTAQLVLLTRGLTGPLQTFIATSAAGVFTSAARASKREWAATDTSILVAVF